MSIADACIKLCLDMLWTQETSHALIAVNNLFLNVQGNLLHIYWPNFNQTYRLYVPFLVDTIPS